MYLLDTDHLTVLQRGGSAARRLLDNLAEVGWSEVATTIVSYEEQTRGWMSYLAKARSAEAQVAAYAHLKRHLESYCAVPILDFDTEAERHYRRIRRMRLRCGAMDLRIAAIALANRATLLTRNIADFGSVTDLVVEDWTA